MTDEVYFKILKEIHEGAYWKGLYEHAEGGRTEWLRDLVDSHGFTVEDFLLASLRKAGIVPDTD